MVKTLAATATLEQAIVAMASVTDVRPLPSADGRGYSQADYYGCSIAEWLGSGRPLLAHDYAWALSRLPKYRRQLRRMGIRWADIAKAEQAGRAGLWVTRSTGPSDTCRECSHGFLNHQEALWQGNGTALFHWLCVPKIGVTVQYGVER